MRRRDFITLVGGAAVWPIAAHAQQAGKLPTIGFLGASASGFAPWAAAFVARLRELGWVEGRTIAIEYRWSEGRAERYAEVAAEFVRLKVDVILTVGSAVPIVKQAATAIPIVFAVAIDPVGSGLVASLAKPGGNVTGIGVLTVELAQRARRVVAVEIDREILPVLRETTARFPNVEIIPRDLLDALTGAHHVTVNDGQVKLTLSGSAAPLTLEQAQRALPANVQLAQYVAGVIAQFASVDTVGGQVTNLKVSLDTYVGVFTLISEWAIGLGVLLLILSLPLAAAAPIRLRTTTPRP